MFETGDGVFCSDLLYRLYRRSGGEQSRKLHRCCMLVECFTLSYSVECSAGVLQEYQYGPLWCSVLRVSGHRFLREMVGCLQKDKDGIFK